MQDIVFYVAAGDALGICKDSYGNQTVAAPSIIRGGEVRLRMRLLAGDGTDTPLPVEPLLECVSWEWVMDSDWDDSTPSKLIADNASITVSDVEDGDGETAKHYTEVVIPIPEMNTQELKDYLASKETATLNGELCGYGEDAKVLFILQVKGFTVRNRIAPSAPPTELADQFLDEAGVRALIETIGKGPQGEKGDPGPANTLTIGTVTTGEPGTQAAASITGESPNQVLNLNIPKGDKGDPGDGGSGSGDMLKSEYDTNSDGKVDAADEADSALNVGGKTAAQVAAAVDNSHTHSNKTTLDKLGESDGALTFNGSAISGGGGTADPVAWDDVTGKPSSFPPADHAHEISDVDGLQSALDAKGTVKSVNGVEPDSSGNVTIETGGGGGGESSSFGEWIPIEPAGEVVVAHNFNDAFAPGVLQLETGGKLYNIDSRVKFNTNDIVIDFTGLELEGEHNARFFGSLASMANLEMPAGAVARYEDYTGSMWSDTSGNSKNLNPSGTVNQDGGAAVFTDNTGKLTCNSGFGLSSQATVCMVVSVPEGSTCWFACELGLFGVFESALSFGDSNRYYIKSADISTILQPNKPASIIFTVNGNNISYYVNNVKLDLGEMDFWDQDVESALGNVYPHKYPFAGGKIYQCVIYDSILTESDIARCYRYAKHKYVIG